MTVKTTSVDEARSDSPQSGKVYGVLAEFDSVDPFMEATRRVRDAGFVKWDTFSPFPVHGIEGAMGMKRTILPFIVLGGGLTGGSLGLLMQWWMNAVDYKLIISGKPFWSIPANIPVIFELTVLLSAFGAVFGMLALNKLPELHHPLFRSERFQRVTTDRFFIAIESSDPRFKLEETMQFLSSVGGGNVEVIEEEED